MKRLARGSIITGIVRTRPARHTVVATGVAALALTLGAACGDTDTGDAVGGSGGSVGFGHPASSAPIYPLLAHGAQEEAAARGYTLLTSSANGDAAAQVDELNAWIAQGIAGMIILPVDNNAMSPIIRRAEENDVKFLAYSNLALAGAHGSVVFDNLQGAELVGNAAGDWVNEVLGGQAKVALLTDNDQEAGRQRIGGAVEALKAKAPDIEIVAEQEGLFADETLPIFQTMLQAHPDINVVFCMADDGCIGAERAFMQTNPSLERQDQMFMAGWDGSLPILEAIASGSSVIRAAGLLDLVEIGQASIRATINAIEGDGETDISISYVLVDQSDPAAARQYIDKYEAILSE